MKIVHLCLASFYIDNYSYQENLLPKYHVYMGHDVTVIASLVSFNDEGKITLLKEESVLQSKDGYKVIRIDYKHMPFYKFNCRFRRYRNLLNLLNEENPDILFIHGVQFWDIRTIVKYINENPKIKVFADNHADYVNSAKNWISKKILHGIVWKYTAQKIEPYLEKCFGVTPLRCDFLRDMYGIKSSKIDLLVMGVDDKNIPFHEASKIKNSIRKDLEIEEGDFVILSGGKIDEKKNIHHLMQAVKELELPSIHLIVFGTICQEMSDSINSYSDSPNIHYIGWLPSNIIINYLLSSDLVIFPGTHSVLWEQAVGAGVPCVFKYWEGMTHVNLGGNCVFINSGSVSEIKETLEKIYMNKDYYCSMKNVAKTKGAFTFSYSNIAPKAISL